MKRLMNTLLFLLVYLMLFFSIEKISSGINQQIFDFSLFLYGLSSVSILLIIGVPVLQKAKLQYLIISGCILYFSGKLLIFRDVQWNTAYFPYYLVSELFLYLVGIFYANRVGAAIEDMNNAIEKAVLPTSNHRIYKKELAGVYIENEFVRGRRYNYPITALVIEPDTNTENYPTNASLEKAIAEIQNKLKVQYVSSKFTDVICNQVRLSDMIVELDEEQGKYLIICPELSYENSPLFGERLKKAVRNNIGISVNYGVLNFPKDVLTFEAMLDKADMPLTGSNIERGQSDFTSTI